mmetsp:Transcript_21285/g.45264  ORF Transcript_21285/g.45264 Transcript_21285/m.45264 type:complete len:320 (-) Transcript_21285:278-1237(-)
MRVRRTFASVERFSRSSKMVCASWLPLCSRAPRISPHCFVSAASSVCRRASISWRNVRSLAAAQVETCSMLRPKSPVLCMMTWYKESTSLFAWACICDLSRMVSVSLRTSSNLVSVCELNNCWRSCAQASSLRKSTIAAPMEASWSAKVFFCRSQSAMKDASLAARWDCEHSRSQRSFAMSSWASRTWLVTSAWCGLFDAVPMLRRALSTRPSMALSSICCSLTCSRVTCCPSSSRFRSLNCAWRCFLSDSHICSRRSWQETMSERSLSVILWNSDPKLRSRSFTCLADASDHHNRSASNSFSFFLPSRPLTTKSFIVA